MDPEYSEQTSSPDVEALYKRVEESENYQQDLQRRIEARREQNRVMEEQLTAHDNENRDMYDRIVQQDEENERTRRGIELERQERQVLLERFEALAAEAPAALLGGGHEVFVEFPNLNPCVACTRRDPSLIPLPDRPALPFPRTPSPAGASVARGGSIGGPIGGARGTYSPAGNSVNRAGCIAQPPIPGPFELPINRRHLVL